MYSVSVVLREMNPAADETLYTLLLPSRERNLEIKKKKNEAKETNRLRSFSIIHFIYRGPYVQIERNRVRLYDSR